MLDRRDDMNSNSATQNPQPQSQAAPEPAPAAITPVAPDEFEDDIPF